MTVETTQVPRRRADGLFASGRRGMQVERGKLHAILLWSFFIVLCLPIFIDAGPFALPPYRIYLILGSVPCAILWATGKLGKVRVVDFMFLFFAVWVVVVIQYHHGIVNEYQFAGFTIIDTVGSFFIGRALVRGVQDFLKFTRLHVITLLILLPFGLIETQTGDPFLIRLLQPFIRTQPVIYHEVRLGMERAQVVFQHPIIWGVYAAGIFGIAMFSLNFGASRALRWFRGIVISAATITSVSSGAFLALAIQLGCAGYEVVMRKYKWRWWLVVGIVVFTYVAIDVLSNRTPFHVFVTYLTLNPTTAYNRILIWIYGTMNVGMNPIFGQGMNNWVRPDWMVASIDNHWLLATMQFGIPGITFLGGGVLTLFFQLALKKNLSPQTHSIRVGMLISLFGMIMAAFTVALWGPILCWFMFFLGASIWMLDETYDPTADAEGGAPAAKPDERRLNFSRFENTHRRG